jgi:hypothetical protein
LRSDKEYLSKKINDILEISSDEQFLTDLFDLTLTCTACIEANPKKPYKKDGEEELEEIVANLSEQ